MQLMLQHRHHLSVYFCFQIQAQVSSSRRQQKECYSTNKKQQTNASIFICTNDFSDSPFKYQTN